MLQLKSLCLCCDRPITVDYYAPLNALRVTHDAPFCVAAYCLLGSDELFTDKATDSARVGAMAEMIIGWDALGYLVARAEDEEDEL